jgi:hypothetical protein
MSYFLSLLLIPFLTMALPDRSRCSPRDLTRQDCRLQSGNWNFQLSNKTISWSDGVWKTVDNLPLSGDGLTWEKGQLKIINKRVFVQLWIWDAGVGEGKVQSLHWYVLEFANKKMNVIVQEVVRKRHPEVVEGKPVKYIYDPMEPHQLEKVLKGLK